MERPRFLLGQLAERLEADCIGDADYELVGLATLASAGPGQLSFLANPKYRSALETTRAGAVILSPDMVESCPTHCVVSASPYLAYAKASQLFAPRQDSGGGIHPSAVVSPSARVDSTASVGANCSVGDDVVIGANTIIGPGSFVGAGTVLGGDCLLHANVTVYHDIAIGDRVIIHSGVVIGADGFGYAPAPDFDNEGWVKIAQLGGVRIGNDVEIGAGTTIDRGALDDTLIGDRVIIDNLVQIAHNVEIGDNTGIAGCTGIAGSARIGRNCTIAGGVGIVGHIDIADGVHVTAMSIVTRSITQSGSYSSGTPMMNTREWRRSAARFTRLDSLAKRLAELEKNR